MTDDEKNEIVARLLQAVGAAHIQQQPAYYPAAPPPKRFNPLLALFDLALIGLAIFGVFALLTIFGVLPELTGRPETFFSTPPALIMPTASIGGSQGRTAPYTAIVEATFPPPIPDVIPTDVPPRQDEPQATPPPVYAPAENVTTANTGPAEHTAFTCGVEPGMSDPNADCAPPEDDPGAKVYSLEGRTFVAEPLPTSSPKDNPGGFDAASEPGNEPTPSR